MEQQYKGYDIGTFSVQDYVRMRPKVFFQSCFDENALDILPFEVLCHAIDEYFDKQCDEIQIEIFSDFFKVSYNAGISLDFIEGDMTKAEAIMTKIYACKNEKKHLAVGYEFCQTGMAIINFACETCELITVFDGKKGIFYFRDGTVHSKEIISSNETNNTTIVMKPNKMIFENLKFTKAGIDTKAKALNSKLDKLLLEVKFN